MLNNINHKMPIYKDCTLKEIMVVAILSLVLLIAALSIFTKCLFGYFWPGNILGSILFIFVTKFILSILQKMKYGKPHAYYQHLLIKKMIPFGLIKSIYLVRIGKWSVRKIHK